MSPPSVDQRRLVIVGATGMVGGYALRYALGAPAVGRDGHQPQNARHLAPQAEEVLHRDFALAEPLSGTP